MPPRSDEEKKRRKLIAQQKQEARKLAKEQAQQQQEQQAAEEQQQQAAAEAEAIANNAKNGSSSYPIGCPLLTVPEEALRRMLWYLDARDLGAIGIASKDVNYGMAEGRISHFLSRMRSGSSSTTTDRVTVPIRMCEDEIEARKMIDYSLQGSNGDFQHG
eukprot:CAMPEP_0198259766 /NCGR_PEP_ID=MMETSP1447-20131203/8880_1 /TAXON_ID=420782 /ORGANISM="Chaetoceros dichaeta, Strain CCMP1751" /LENGTH=159 /DNA_ID=CAMNT_0043947241 /DNA_START=54 /DNA_END=529 /DNA_ORIENTATION=+